VLETSGTLCRHRVLKAFRRVDVAAQNTLDKLIENRPGEEEDAIQNLPVCQRFRSANVFNIDWTAWCCVTPSDIRRFRNGL
jgi:hypothetical protein